MATLTPSDFLGPGTPSSATITVITASTYAEMQLQAFAAQIQRLLADAVTTGGNRNALTQLVSHVVAALQLGNATGAQQHLQQAMSRTDGCALHGEPDGNGPGRDWITTCAAQEQIYVPLVDVLAATAKPTTDESVSFAKTRSAPSVRSLPSGTLPFSCPFGATKSSKRQQAAAQSEGRKSEGSKSEDARAGSVRHMHANGGQRLFFRLLTGGVLVRIQPEEPAPN